MDMELEGRVRAALATVNRTGGADPGAALTLAGAVERLLHALKVADGTRPESDSSYLTDEALVVAAATLWLADSSDSRGALWSIARRLSPEIRAAVDASSPCPLRPTSPAEEAESRRFLDSVLLRVLWERSKAFREDRTDRPEALPAPAFGG